MKSIQNLFPGWLLASVFYTQCIAACLNFDLFDFRELLILFCWIPVFTAPWVFTGKRVFYWIALVLVFLEGVTGLIHWLVLHGPLTASSLFVIANTNSGEAADFVTLKMSWQLLLILPYLALVTMAIKNPPNVERSKKSNWVALVLLLISFIFIGDNLAHQRLVRKGLPQSTKAIVSFVEEAKAYSKLKQRKVRSVAVQQQVGKRLFVLIIGESANRNHWSLYGYSRNTNPYLEKRKDILLFKNVVSGYSNTLSAVLSLMTESNLDNRKGFDESVSLIDVFHSAGYKTYWLSNQSPIGIWDNGVYNLARTADVVDFINLNASSSIESIHTRSFDEKLLEPFQQALKDTSANKFIVLHLMGSHSAYEKRYPSTFELFEDNSTNEKDLIAKYDNSIFYTDYLLDEVYNVLTKFSLTHSNYSCSAIYLSDHAENVFDEQGKVGHDYAGSLPKANVEIPFVVWSSKPYAHDSLLGKINTPFVNDDVYHAVLDLNGIGTASFDKSRSLFNADFNSKRSRILEDGKNYDEK